VEEQFHSFLNWAIDEGDLATLSPEQQLFLYPVSGKLGGSHKRFKRKNTLALLGIEERFLGLPTRNPVTTSSELPKDK
jgi:hypothetical protein